MAKHKNDSGVEMTLGEVVAVGSAVVSNKRHAKLGQRIQEAMAASVRDSLAQGLDLTNPKHAEVIRQRQLQAAEAVKADYREGK